MTEGERAPGQACLGAQEGDRDDQEGPVGECLDLGASRKPMKGASYQEEEQGIPSISAMGTPGVEGTGMSHWIGGGGAGDRWQLSEEKVAGETVEPLHSFF